MKTRMMDALDGLAAAKLLARAKVAEAEVVRLAAELQRTRGAALDSGPEVRWPTAFGGYRVRPWMGRWSWAYEEVHDGYMTRDEAEAAARTHDCRVTDGAHARPLLEILRGLTDAESCELARMLDDGTVAAALVRESLGAAEKRYFVSGEGWVDSQRIVELGAELAAGDIKLTTGEGEWALPDGVSPPVAYRNPSRLWLLDDGERNWIMAPTQEEALAYWRDHLADGYEDADPPTIADVTDKADKIVIRTDEDAGGPPRTARMWMDEDNTQVALIGTTAW